MELISLITDKKKIIFDNANLREKLFYKYLQNDIEPSTVNNLGDIDKVCVAVFTKLNIDISKDIQKLRNSTPAKNLHYSYDLISMCAVALYSSDKDIQALKNFYQIHGTKEKFIVQKLFPNDFSLSAQENEETYIAELTKDVFLNRNNEPNYDLLYLAIEHSNDLIDIFIIEESIKELVKFHPDAKLKQDYDFLNNQFIRYERKLRWRSNFIFNLITTGIVCYCVYLLSNPIINRWEIFEPIAYLKDIIQVVFSFILALGYNKSINILNFLKDIKEKQLKFIFKMNGLDYEKIKILKDNNN